MKNKIILILGAFNPPTTAHIEMGRVLHEDYPDANICYVIANADYVENWKAQQKILPMNIRAQLLLNAIDGRYASVSLFEGSKTSDGKTITTARHFRDEGYDVTLCIGSDNIQSIPNWYKGLKLAEEFNFIVFCRKSEDMDIVPESMIHLKDHFIFKNHILSNISASEIRKASSSGYLETVKQGMPSNVYEFLHKHPY